MQLTGGMSGINKIGEYMNIHTATEVAFKNGENKGRVDTINEIFDRLEKYFSMYSHIHKHAQEAKIAEEEYIDGTACELQSVWDAITLDKNGWADYETMNKLRDNINYIAKSDLLTEIEDDIRQMRKEYVEHD